MSGPVEGVADLERKLQCCTKEANIIVAGKQGSGKTELFNGLCGIRIKENNDPTKKLLLINKHSFEDQRIVVWDTCGLYKDSHWKSEVATKQIKEKIKCMQSRGEKILLYTIPVNQTRFIQNADDNADINCLRKLTIEFGVEIWDHALIILTFANDHYEEIKDDLDCENAELTELYSQSVTEMEGIIRKSLQMINIPDEVAKNVKIIPAGYVRHEQAASCLQCDPAGKSWVWNIWQEIVKVSPKDFKYQILQFCFDKMISDPFLYGDSYLSYVKLHGALYRSTAIEARAVGCSEGEEVYQNLGLSYSYLRLLKGWFDYHDVLKTKSRKCSEEVQAKMAVWNSLTAGIKIIVSGKERSGKSTLVKAMISNKANDFSYSGKESKSIYKQISCTILEEAPHLVQPSHIVDSTVIIVCVKLSATKEVMTRVLEPIAKKQPQNIVVVLTFADDNRSSKPWTELVRTQSLAVKDTLQELQLNESALNSLSVCPAGYQATIRDDPAQKNWVMDIWLKCIASATLAHQPALTILANHFIYGGKKLQILSSHKDYFREQLLLLLKNMIKEHKIDY